jgi:hypothetical protein
MQPTSSGELMPERILYPQLREPALTHVTDQEDRDTAYLDAIHKSSQSEYLNAILKNQTERLDEISKNVSRLVNILIIMFVVFLSLLIWR